MIIVEWPSMTAASANLWRVLDLSGLTHSVRESRRQIKSGNVYLNGSQVFDSSLRQMVPVGTPFNVAIHQIDGSVRAADILLVNMVRPNKSRQTVASYVHYKEGKGNWR